MPDMEVIAQIAPATRNPNGTHDRIEDVIGRGATYELARDSITVPDGWKLVAYLVPEHLDRVINS